MLVVPSTAAAAALLVGALLACTAGATEAQAQQRRLASKSSNDYLSTGYRGGDSNSADNDDDADDDDDTRPLFVLHVGPPKTGTTTFQRYSTQRAQLLREDNLYYLGRMSYGSGTDGGTDVIVEAPEEEEATTTGGREGRSDVLVPEFPKDDRWHPCLRECDCDSSIWDDLAAILSHHRDANHDVLFSNERLSWISDTCDEVWTNLTSLLSPKDWRVRIVYTYRRYYDWLPSRYHQENNPKSKAHYATWPDVDEPLRNTLPEYLEHTLLTSTKIPQPLKIYRLWKRRFPDAEEWSIWNMHDGDGGGGGHFLTTAFCDVIPEAEGACAELTANENGEFVDMVLNPSSGKASALELDRLATAAYRRGWIAGAPDDDGGSTVTVTATVSREEARDAAGIFAADELGWHELADFPLVCPSTVVEAGLLRASLDVEAEIVPDFFNASPLGEERLRSDFADLIGEGGEKFCSVDADAAFDGDGRWEALFRGLGGANEDEKAAG